MNFNKSISINIDLMAGKPAHVGNLLPKIPRSNVNPGAKVERKLEENNIYITYRL